jgi:poly(A) polymerase
MPHVTLLYPFLPQARFDVIEEELVHACGSVPSFEVRLARFRHFHHGGGRSTLWLAPEPAEPLARLQSALQSAVPACDDVSRHEGGFTPHLSVGQVRDHTSRARLQEELQSSWKPLSFPVREIALIWRRHPPDDVFRVGRRIPLAP